MARGVAGDLTEWRPGDGKAAVSQQVISPPLYHFVMWLCLATTKKVDSSAAIRLGVGVVWMCFFLL